ncbi:hypothetical protein MIMGU_mgv1a021343mg, partial [Erythranthe guttata]
EKRRESGVGEESAGLGGDPAVCCCFPCGMMHLLILVVYCLPVSMWRKKRKHSSSEENQQKLIRSDSTPPMRNRPKTTIDNKTWDRFYGDGFWRSSSQRNDDE